MSRRKQARPIRHLDSEEPPDLPLGNGGGSEVDCADLDGRRSPIEERRPESEPAADAEQDEADGSVASPAGSVASRDSPRARLITEETKLGALQANLASSLSSLASLTGSPAALPGLLQALKAGSPSLESLQSTGMAVAQLTASAVANNTHNPKALQELAILQSTLFTLQQQQVFQMNLIQQLQAQLRITKSEERRDGSESEGEPRAAGSPPPSDRQTEPPLPSPPLKEEPLDGPPPSQLPPPPPPPPPSSAPPPPSLASSVIQPTDDGPTESGNSLQLLQKTTQQVLSNASQGLLANNMVDEMYRHTKAPGGFSGDRKEAPFFKHRCRYCGKVFGSDSALQIHIRSHTGERPYKCNICGNRFTTKGNLKVHFQRHSARFPHVKMNINMVPEHMDKFFPPLLAQLGELPETPQPPVPPPHFGSPLLGPPPLYSRALNDETDASPGEKVRPTGDRGKTAPPPPPPPPPPPQLPPTTQQPPTPEWPEAGDEPLSLTKPRVSRPSGEEPTPPPPPPPPPVTQSLSDRLRELESLRRLLPPMIKRPADDEAGLDQAKRPRADEPEVKREPIEEDAGAPLKPGSEVDERSRDSRLSEPRDSAVRSDSEPADHSPERPQNLSKSATPPVPRSAALASLGQRMMPSFPFSFPMTSMPQPAFPFHSGSFNPLLNLPPDVDPSKHPNIYTNLLPKPGVNDNSWEALIEVQKTSETSKLQQLVDNIENKITDPNQCVICQRVLSCKSALQMHYRTHTGERPFKCKICSRAFTTKGNLKTHMGVHRSKPPVRMSHQCPVCHKRFHNGLILQQHIKLHTGEPTDMTPEQIAAGEVLEPMLPLAPGFPPAGMFPGGFPLPPSHLPSFPGFPGGFPLHLPKRPLSVGSRDRDENGNRTKEGGAATNGERSDASGEDSMDSGAAGSGSPQPAEPAEPVSPAAAGSGSGSPAPYSGSADETGAQPLDLTPRSAAAPAVPSPAVSAAASPLMRLPLGGFPNPFTSGPMFGQFGGLDARFPGVAGYPVMRGNTTCNLCFKVFACQSALDIHYRSHTKERPFKCPRCDKGFSTKGNMKQHLMTHKPRESGAGSGSGSGSDGEMTRAPSPEGRSPARPAPTPTSEQPTPPLPQPDDRERWGSSSPPLPPAPAPGLAPGLAPPPGPLPTALDDMMTSPPAPLHLSGPPRAVTEGL
ncbi:homeotic protein spalt-major-like [Amphibalanus amphitrite]|uniref:homeotic protein spalt-major-like n=1 Tax=Amphibalanus amphitrite TaxID=1232801 RepID=UPI001C90A304|nr:homeotic protein spalt-major-like [Amphibalanus amphitrite]